MKHINKLLAVLCLSFACAFAHAQTGMVTVSGSNLEDSSGTKVTNATVCFAPVDNQGKAISYRINGNGQAIAVPVCTQVTAGAWSMTVADTNLSYPQNVCFSVTATDNTSGNQLLGPGYGCVQPAYNTTQPNNWCVSGTCNFDQYQPSGPNLGVTMAPTLQIGTVSTLSAGSNATAMLSGAYPNYTLSFGIPQGASGTGGSGGGGGGTWGSITGTLSNQTDLQNALNGKVATTVTINGHALSANINLGFADLTAGALPSGTTATTQTAGDSSTDVATDAFVAAALSGKVSTTVTINGHALSANINLGFSDLAAGALPGGTTATTQATADNSADVATDAFVHNVISAQPKPSYSKVIIYELPAQGDLIPVIDLPNAVTIKRVYCSIKDGTNVVFNLYSTSEANPWTTTGGTAVFASDQTCTTSGLTVTSFASASVGVHVPLEISVTSETGNPSFVDITVEYQ